MIKFDQLLRKLQHYINAWSFQFLRDQTHNFKMAVLTRAASIGGSLLCQWISGNITQNFRQYRCIPVSDVIPPDIDDGCRGAIKLTQLIASSSSRPANRVDDYLDCFILIIDIVLDAIWCLHVTVNHSRVTANSVLSAFKQGVLGSRPKIEYSW